MEAEAVRSPEERLAELRARAHELERQLTDAASRSAALERDTAESAAALERERNDLRAQIRQGEAAIALRIALALDETAAEIEQGGAP